MARKHQMEAMAPTNAKEMAYIAVDEGGVVVDFISATPHKLAPRIEQLTHWFLSSTVVQLVPMKMAKSLLASPSAVVQFDGDLVEENRCL